MWLTIAQILVFVGWISFTIYSFFNARKKIKNLANSNGLKVSFECKKCHTIHNYSYDEYTKIVRKVRNETTVRNFSSIKRTKEYKYPCQVCESKQWQKQLTINPFIGTPNEKEYFKIFIFFVIKVFACGIFVALFFGLTEAL